jgi:hypothetical protein
MALGEQVKLSTLQKRGTANCVNVSNRLRERLGWNRGDALRLDVVQGALVVTKVILPPMSAVLQRGGKGDSVSDEGGVSDNK